MRVRLAVLAGLAVCTVLRAAPPQFGEMIEVNVVNADVHVTDRNGRPVTDLRREDFEVFEDGKRVEVSHFRAVRPETRPAEAAPPAAPAPSRPAEPRTSTSSRPMPTPTG